MAFLHEHVYVFFGDDMTQKINPFIQFKAYSSGTPSILPVLCTHQPSLAPEHVHHPPRKLGTYGAVTLPNPFPLQPLMRFLSLVGLPILHRGKYSDADECFIYVESR